jgi:hypothetical protein
MLDTHEATMERNLPEMQLPPDVSAVAVVVNQREPPGSAYGNWVIWEGARFWLRNLDVGFCTISVYVWE